MRTKKGSEAEASAFKYKGQPPPLTLLSSGTIEAAVVYVQPLWQLAKTAFRRAAARRAVEHVKESARTIRMVVA